MKIITRKQAIELGLKHYYTGKLCIRGHDDKRLTSSSTCCSCARENHFPYYAKHKEQALASISKWQRENKDVVNSISRQYRKNNPEQTEITHKRYYENNKETKLAYNKEWRAENQGILRLYNVKRRNQILKATPIWADLSEIRKIYQQAADLQQSTGIKYHVDHIIPLQGDLVCGLHVHTNLQIITRLENLAKGKQFKDQ
jgi:hypothetical protein